LTIRQEAILDIYIQQQITVLELPNVVREILRENTEILEALFTTIWFMDPLHCTIMPSSASNYDVYIESTLHLFTTN
jgi:hypothetical protein